MSMNIKGVPTRFLGNFATASLPAAANLASLQAGDVAWDTTTSTLKVYSGTAWVAAGGLTKGPAQADTTATDVAGLKTDFNALLVKLRTAGVIAT